MLDALCRTAENTPRISLNVVMYQLESRRKTIMHQPPKHDLHLPWRTNRPESLPHRHLDHLIRTSPLTRGGAFCEKCICSCHVVRRADRIDPIFIKGPRHKIITIVSANWDL